MRVRVRLWSLKGVRDEEMGRDQYLPMTKRFSTSDFGPLRRKSEGPGRNHCLAWKFKSHLVVQLKTATVQLLGEWHHAHFRKDDGRVLEIRMPQLFPRNRKKGLVGEGYICLQLRSLRREDQDRLYDQARAFRSKNAEHAPIIIQRVSERGKLPSGPTDHWGESVNCRA